MAAALRFGPFELGDGELTREGRQVPVSRLGLSLLGALAGAEGPVSRSALLEAAWPGLVVDDANLTVQVASLRKALGPRRDGQDWIVTVPRVGYRLHRDRATDADRAA
jgi:DNA-binding winged helix-turn-helix (wHTH) protein